jgi:hypothetical protein
MEGRFYGRRCVLHRTCIRTMCKTSASRDLGLLLGVDDERCYVQCSDWYLYLISILQRHGSSSVAVLFVCGMIPSTRRGHPVWCIQAFNAQQTTCSITCNIQRVHRQTCIVSYTSTLMGYPYLYPYLLLLHGKNPLLQVYHYSHSALRLCGGIYFSLATPRMTSKPQSLNHVGSL